MDSETTLYRANKLLLRLDDYKGIEVREKQLITEYTIAHEPSVPPHDVKQALDYLYRKGYADWLKDPLRGIVWSITPSGKATARALRYDEGE